MSGSFKKIVTWGMVAFVVFFVAFRPGLAADAVQTLGSVAADVLTGIGKFFDGIAN